MIADAIVIAGLIHPYRNAGSLPFKFEDYLQFIFIPIEGDPEKSFREG